MQLAVNTGGRTRGRPGLFLFPVRWLLCSCSDDVSRSEEDVLPLVLSVAAPGLLEQ